MNLVAVIPVFNEAAAIEAVVAGARLHAPVIVVDDGSDDGSGDLAGRAGADVLRHHRRRGKANALRTGIAAARARGAAAVITLDGDGQHVTDDLPALVRAARETPDRLIVGNRLAGSAVLPRGRLNAMHVAAFFVEWVSALSIRDTQSGFRVYPMALLDDVPLSRGGFVFETEVLIAAARRGWRVREVPVVAIPSAWRRSRFRPVRDGMAIGAYIARPVAERWAREIGALPRTLLASIAAGDARRRAEGLARLRLAALAAAATATSPLLLAAAAAQVALGPRAPDLVTPLVRRVYAANRLTAWAGGADGAPALASEGAR
jgi:hypothetical protein